MDTLSLFVRTEPGERARPGLPPSPERLRELARLIAERRYRVSSQAVAEAVLRGQAGRRD